jgi:hypothetical protein
VATENELLSEWQRSRFTSQHYFQLQHEVIEEFEYKGPHWGHPSNYARTRFVCGPARELLFTVQTRWPSHLAEAYCDALQRAIGHAIVDSLMTSYYPYRGCAVTLVDVGWDDVMSSELAFYRSAKGAMDTLREDGAWTLIDGETDSR